MDLSKKSPNDCALGVCHAAHISSGCLDMANCSLVALIVIMICALLSACLHAPGVCGKYYVY
jgi:hypothetical protein